MKKSMIVIALLLGSILLAGSALAAGGWTKIKDSNGIKLYERSVPGTDLMEYMAVTTMDAKMEVIGEALRDIPRYTKWLADCESASIQKKYDRNTFILHIVQNPPIIEKRDIVLKNEAVYDYENGKAQITFYCTDELKIPVEKKRVRITTMNGLFQMEYLGRNKTKFIYKLKVDPAGNISKKVAYSVMKNYPFNSLKDLKKIIHDGKYAELAKGTEEETQINARSFNAASVKKIFGDTITRVVKDKAAMAAILASSGDDIQSIASSGSAYPVVEKAAKNMYFKYLDRKVTDKKTLESLKNNHALFAEVTGLITTYSEASDETIDSMIARYNK
jgi:hypothetical protein